ncbi:MAG: hypothetical protein RLY87_1583 [Chloroflexota bacterium]|jgi:hypothetical protein
MDLQTFLSQTYPFTVTSMTDAPRGLVAQTHIATTADGPNVFVKVVHAPLFKAHLANSAAAHAYLATHLGERINAPIATRTGAGVARYGECIVAVSQMIDASSTEAYDISAFGMLIATLHSIPYAPHVPTRHIADFEHIALLDTLATHAFAGTGSAPWRAVIAERLAPWHVAYLHYRQRMRHFRQAFRLLPHQPLVYTHGDAGGNVVANDPLSLHLIDWDYIGRSEPERDIWVFEHYPEFIAGYQQVIPTYEPNEVRLQYAAYRQFFDYLVFFLTMLQQTPADAQVDATIDNLISLFTDWCPPHLR